VRRRSRLTRSELALPELAFASASRDGSLWPFRDRRRSASTHEGRRVLANERKETKTTHLIALAGGRRLALALQDVIEVMRPLPVSKLAGAPAFVLGAAVIRGAPVPVVDAGALLGEPGLRACTRFVSLRLGARSAALAVGGLAGLRTLRASELAVMPPLLRDTAAGALAAVGALDEELLLVLQAGRLVPEEVWQALGTGVRP
jgi:purine-binding chemotaxis protein CheW